MTTKNIEERKQCSDIKSQFWFNDKEIMLALRECISFFGDKLSAQKLAKAIDNNLDLQIVINTM